MRTTVSRVHDAPARRKHKLIHHPCSLDDPRRRKGHDMKDMEQQMDAQEAALAIYLEQNDTDQLTDILVAALDDALRLMQEDFFRETLH